MNNRRHIESLNGSMGFFFARVRLKPLLCLAIAFAFSVSATGQDRYEISDAPPPLKQISAEERKQLTASKNPKDRTRLALEMMELRLAKAATKSAAESYSEAFLELGGFHALMDDMLRYLDKLPGNKRDTLNNFKRFEIGLRRLAPRLELLRREMPSEKERYIYYLARDLREARAKAIEPLFGETVVPGLQQDKP